jgi:hypothetical protein
MTMMILATIVCLLALMPAVMIRRNLSAYAPPAWAPKHRHENLPAISLLIPARGPSASLVIGPSFASRMVR